MERKKGTGTVKRREKKGGRKREKIKRRKEEKVTICNYKLHSKLYGQNNFACGAMLGPAGGRCWERSEQQRPPFGDYIVPEVYKSF